MDKESLRSNNNTNSNIPNVREKSGGGGGEGGDGSLLLRASSDTIRQTTTTSDFVLQWGNRKRLRCMKVQVKDKDDSSASVQKTTVRVDRRVIRSEKDPSNQPATTANNNHHHQHYNHNNGFPNLRQRPSSPQQPQRILRYYTNFFLFCDYV